MDLPQSFALFFELENFSFLQWFIWLWAYGSIPIHTIFRGMNIHKSQLFWCELQGYKVLTHCHMVSCFELNWKLLALLWEPVSHAQKRMMSLPRVPQALVNIRNGCPDTHGCSPFFLLIFPVPTNDLPWKHLRCTPSLVPWCFHAPESRVVFGLFMQGHEDTLGIHEDLWSTLTIQLQIHEVHLPNWPNILTHPRHRRWRSQRATSGAQPNAAPCRDIIGSCRAGPGCPGTWWLRVSPIQLQIHRNPIVPMNLGCWWYWFEINFYRNHHFFFFQRKVSGFRALCFSGKNSWDRTVILQLSQVKTGLHFCWAWSPTSAIDVFPSWQGTTRAYFSTVHRDMAEGFNILKKAYEFVRQSATGVGGAHRPSILTGKNHSIIYRVIQHLSHFELSFGREPPKKCTSPTWPGLQAISCTGGRYGRVFVDDRRCSRLVADEWEVGACSCLAGWWF